MTLKKTGAIVLALCFSLFGILLLNKTCLAAANAKITGIKGIIKDITDIHSIDGCHGTFYPTIAYGDSCKYKGKNICGKALDHFKCIEPSDSCTRDEDYIYEVNVSKASKDFVNRWTDYRDNEVFINDHPNFDRYEYYKLVFYVTNRFQNVEGIVYRKKIYKLTVKSVDEHGNSLANVAGLGDSSAEAFYDETATVRHGVTSTGYTFLYWIDGNGNRYGNSGTVSYSAKLKKNTTVKAVYREFEATSSLDIKSKKSTWGSYQDGLIYAKPTDKVDFQVIYSPLAQSGYSVMPQRISVDGGGSWAINTTLGQALGNWSNSFKVGGMVDGAYNYQNGDIGQKVSNDKSYIVSRSAAGSELSETAWLSNDSVRTPKAVQIGLDGGASIGRVYTGLSDTVKVAVPYNFNNVPNKPGKPDDEEDPDPDDSDDPVIPNDDEGSNEKIVFAGEEDTFEFAIDVNPRENPITEGNYATIVRDAKWQLGLCIGNTACDNGNYNYSNQGTGTLNESYLMEGVRGIQKRLSINIPDIEAGSRICLVAEVWPADSGEFTNWQVSGYKNSWRRSPRSCYTVAKRPSVQIWGGNVYSRASLNTSTAVKNNLAGYSQYAYDARDKKGTFVFGSWSELGVIGNDTISGFGSGASMGYAKNEGSETDGRVKTWPSYSPEDGAGNNAFIVDKDVTPPGGGAVSAFCGRVPLTIPNSPCGTSVGNLSSTVSITKAASEKASIIDLLISGQDSASHIHNPVGGVNMGLVGSIIEGNTTKVVSSDNDLVVDGDLIYLDKVYLNYEQMPKLVIYSKKNVYIDCTVSRIDALIIAENTVVTCKNFEGNLTDKNVTKHINDPANSNQLYINGTIIASRLIANRTYGAATGANSIVPAEVINFDPTLYRFGGSAAADDDTTGRLDVTYMHELAPRL